MMGHEQARKPRTPPRKQESHHSPKSTCFLFILSVRPRYSAPFQPHATGSPCCLVNRLVISRTSVNISGRYQRMETTMCDCSNTPLGQRRIEVIKTGGAFSSNMLRGFNPTSARASTMSFAQQDNSSEGILRSPISSNRLGELL